MAKNNGNASNGGGMSAGRDKYRDGRWSVPSRRAKGYAEERKAKVHMHGPKEGRQLTDYEAGMRSGYLQCQNDHAGLYKYKQAMDSGMPRRDAADVSRMKKGWLQRIKDFLAGKK